MKRIELNCGDRFEMLTVLKEVDPVYTPGGQINRVFRCICDCGNTTEVRLLHLKRNRIKSCGCLGKIRNGEGDSKLCKIWRQMKYRCKHQENYIKKNISVCDEWYNDWDAFKKWSLDNGYKQGLNIDRIDNYGNYNPNNCRWVTPVINANNKENTFMVNYKGEDCSFMLLMRELNLLDVCNTIRRRIKRGWNVADAIEKPIRKGNYKTKIK